MSRHKSLMARAGSALLLAGVLVVTSTATAEAAFVLRLTEGASSVTITDGGAGDSNPVVGAITFIGSVGVFDLNVSTGLSKPVLPETPTTASMDLNSVNTSSSAGTLIIELTDTDFSATSAGTLTGAVGGTTQGTVSFSACKNESNGEFDCDDADAQITIGPFVDGPGPGGTPFSGTSSADHGALGSYSMTLIATITHAGAATSSFDFEVANNVPEPASMALFGLGLLGAGLAARRRRAAR